MTISMIQKENLKTNDWKRGLNLLIPGPDFFIDDIDQIRLSISANIQIKPSFSFKIIFPIPMFTQIF